MTSVDNQIKLARLQKLAKLGSVPIYEEITALEDKDTELKTEIDDLAEKQNMLENIPMKIDDLSETLAEVHQAVTHKEDTGEIIIKIDPAKIKGDKGESYILTSQDKDEIAKKIKMPTYVLTSQDKNEIASKIEVPIVEKIIEKTEVIKEPIVTNEIKEIAIVETSEQVRDKLEGLQDENRLSISAIHKLEETLDELKNRPVGGRVGGGFSKMAMDGHIIDDEVPAGSVNGSNVTFTLANIPNPPSSLKLFVNGQRMKAGGEDFTLSSGTITFITAPPTTSILLADYRH